MSQALRTPAAAQRRRLALRLAVLPLVLLAAGLGGWAFWLEPASLYNEDHTLWLPRWPRECDGLRVAVLADIHTGSPHNGLDKLEEVVRLTQVARPDLVLLAGDYVIHGVVGGDYVSPEQSADVLARLQAPLGVHAVLGNHDYWIGAEEVRGALQAVGIAVYDDASTRLSKGACHFWLTGIDDLWEGEPDIEAALALVPAGSASLAFTHNPDLFPEVPDRVALTIAGHTHGGQVHLPWLGRPVVPSRFGERFASGQVVEAGRHLFVSTGLGTSILPVRFRVPPEVSVLTLRSAEASAMARPTDIPRTIPSAKRG